MMDPNRLNSAARKTLCAIAVVTLVVTTGSARAQAPLVDHLHFKDPPLPPPCAPDGVCKPRRATWGYYQPRWRKWPGEAPREGADGAAEERSLPTIESIPPKLEDREAPPPSEDSTQLDGGAAPPALPPLRPALEPPAAPPAAPAEEAGARPPAPRPVFEPLPQTNNSAAGDGGVAIRLPATGSSTVAIVQDPLPANEMRRKRVDWARSLDTPPPMPTSLPQQSRIRWSKASDTPPQLPAGLGGGSVSSPEPVFEQVSSYPAPREWSTANDRSGRFDSAVRRAGAAVSGNSAGKRAFYQPDSPPRFTLGASEGE